MLKYIKTNETELRKEIDENGKVKYRGFIIKACLNDFDNTYYTIINPFIGSHVHASTLSLSIQICDLTRKVLQNPYKSPKVRHDYSIDVYGRAYRLAFRQQKYQAKAR